MTAFAGNETNCGSFTLSCELRSVNHRYFDLIFKLPDRLRYTETVIRSEIAKLIKRGKIECAVSYKKQNVAGDSFAVSMETVKSLLGATQQIEQLMQNPRSFSALDVLSIPGVQQEPEVDLELLSQCVIELIKQTVEKLLHAREREGKQLGILIEERCQLMQNYIEQAKHRMPVVLQQIRNKLAGRIAELATVPDFDRLEQEMLLLTQKLDVDEELDRLETHIQEVCHILTIPDAKGRRLDFLMQEMNREANTLGSKSSDKEMTKISIELKVLIEQMREQIQNIE